MATPLETLIASVSDQAAVYSADLAAAQRGSDPVPTVPPETARTPQEIAVDGVAHYVFNTLRGVEDTVDGATFEEIRAVIVAKGGF